MTVSLATVSGNFEVSNSRGAIRIPILNGEPLAPIQAIRYSDGVWSNNKTSYLHKRSWYQDPPAEIDPYLGGETKVLLNTPDKVEHKFMRPDFDYTHAKEGLFLPGGEGVLRTIYDDAIMVKEYTDCDVGYSFSVWTGLKPNKGRYPGTNVKFGYDPDGGFYGENIPVRYQPLLI